MTGGAAGEWPTATHQEVHVIVTNGAHPDLFTGGGHLGAHVLPSDPHQGQPSHRCLVEVELLAPPQFLSHLGAVEIHDDTVNELEDVTKALSLIHI